jgi:ferredoxin-NADP reductase
MEDNELAIAAVHSVGPDAVAIEFETPEGFAASPGQFVKVTRTIDGEPESRFYTVSSPDARETFEVTVEIDPEGEFTPALAEVEPGDSLTTSGPYGSSYYEGEPRILIIAGGPGVGPAVGIAERTLADGGEAGVVYRDASPIHSERLEALADAGAFVRVLDPDESLADPVAEFNSEGTQVFVYGFAAFLDDAIDAIEAADGDGDDAKVENFG